jgi:hypothetical protein
MVKDTEASQFHPFGRQILSKKETGLQDLVGSLVSFLLLMS